MVFRPGLSRWKVSGSLFKHEFSIVRLAVREGIEVDIQRERERGRGRRTRETERYKGADYRRCWGAALPRNKPIVPTFGYVYTCMCVFAFTTTPRIGSLFVRSIFADQLDADTWHNTTRHTRNKKEKRGKVQLVEWKLNVSVVFLSSLNLYLSNGGGLLNAKLTDRSRQRF